MKLLPPFFLLLILLSYGCVPLPLAPPKFDPSLQWKTVETPHFSIHFHQGEDAFAAEAAADAEAAHARLTRLLDWTPAGKTELIIVDSSDTVNGEATPFPYNAIYISPTPPAAGFLTPTRYRHWIRALIFHEYTHIVQLDQASGLPGVFRKLFGRIILPNVLQPLWLIEGLAVFEESEAETTDRAAGAFSEMILRTAILEDRFKTIDQAHIPDSWPEGLTPYYYGAAFHRFIKEKYGEEKITELVRGYSARLVPFFVESNAENTLGESLGNLWATWRLTLGAKYLDEKNILEKEGLTETASLTTSGFWNLAPVPAPDGKTIAYTEINPHEEPRIRFIGSDGASRDLSVIRNSGEGLSWSPDGRSIVFSQMEVLSNFSSYNDLYRFDLGEERLRRLTVGLRARDPDFSPDGEGIVFVQERPNRSDLMVWKKGIVTPVYLGGENIYFSAPRWSPDGEKIALSVWRDGNQDVALLDLAAGNLTYLTEDAALDLAPVWSPDGETILFSSDRGGIFNLFAFTLSDQKFYQITHLLGGAFTPFVSPDARKIYFSSYHANGFEIVSADWDRSSWREISNDKPELPSIETTKAGSPTVTLGHPYSEPATLLPRFWLPLLGQDETGTTVGLFTAAFDPLGKDHYEINLYYGTQTERASYQFDYYNDHFAPTLHFQLLDRAEPHGGLLIYSNGATATYWERNRRLRLEALFPLLAFQRQHYFLIGYQREALSSLTLRDGSLLLPREGILSGLLLSWIYNSSHEHPFSISREEGRRIFITEEVDPAWGGDFRRSRTIAGWREYQNLPWPNQILAAQLSGGLAGGDRLPQKGFQLGGLNAPFADFEEAPFLLRGYPTRALRGERILSASIEYRFPFLNIERGYDTLPFFLRRFHGTFFGDMGEVWDPGVSPPPFKTAIGAAVGSDFLLGHYLPVRLEAGVARGLAEGGITQIFFSLGNAF